MLCGVVLLYVFGGVIRCDWEMLIVRDVVICGSRRNWLRLGCLWLIFMVCMI